MPILSIQGNLLDVAPDKVEAIAFKIRDGFSQTKTMWLFEFTELNISLQSVDEMPLETISGDDFNRVFPWKRREDTLWEIIPEKYRLLKYVYLFESDEYNYPLSSINEIDRLINRCLNKLKEKEVRSVAFIFIPTVEDDITSANRMIKAINQWMIDNNYEMDVYLVDRTGGFNDLE